jgi:hypothetical protein
VGTTTPATCTLGVVEAGDQGLNQKRQGKKRTDPGRCNGTDAALTGTLAAGLSAARLPLRAVARLREMAKEQPGIVLSVGPQG